MEVIDSEIVHKIDVTNDMQIHVTVTRTPAGEFIDVRNYVPSVDRYARGIVFPADLGRELIEALRQARRRPRA